MTPTNLTPRAQSAINRAAQLALVLLDTKGIVQEVLKNCHVDVEFLRSEIKWLASGNGGQRASANAEPPAADKSVRPESSFRHYLLVDDSVQWFARIVRVDPDAKNTASLTPGHSVTESADLPSALGGDFVANVYGREQVAGVWREAGQNQSWRAWTLSPQEYARIQRLIELNPAVEEARKLAAYDV